jgi:hypothetical protein
MKNRYLIFLIIMANCINANATAKKISVYASWGYNRAIYTKSNIHFKGTTGGMPYNFTIEKAKAKDKPDFNYIKSIELTIPQYNYRIGLYLDSLKTSGIEINFDHTKYVVIDNQTAYVSGFAGNTIYNKNLIIDPLTFVHFEHTNGANFMSVNYFKTIALVPNKLGLICKAGAGIVIPKTDVTLFGTRLDNKFHVAGYLLSNEYALRFYPRKKIYLELSTKAGFANYVQSLSLPGGQVNHSFWFLEGILSFGLKF